MLHFSHPHKSSPRMAPVLDFVLLFLWETSVYLA